jgi:hypothetical protein
MADRYAVQNGNWSSTSTWDGDTLPQAGDVVRPNGFTVTINQDVTVDLLTNNASGLAVGGGVFRVDSSGYTITANVEHRHTTTSGMLLINANTTVIGNISGNVLFSSSNLFCIVVAANTTLNVIGNIKGGAGNSSGGIQLSNINSVVNITGNVDGGDSNNAGNGIRIIGSNSAVYLDGIATGGLASPAITCQVNNGILGGAVTAAPNPVNRITSGLVNSSNSPNFRVKNLIFGGIDSLTRFSQNQPTFTHIGFNGDSLTLTDPSTTDQASTSDVRQGVSYNSGASIGTLKVPNSGSVALGVPFDNNSVGTALLTGDSWIAAISSSNDPFAERLKNVATVQTTAAQIAAF